MNLRSLFSVFVLSAAFAPQIASAQYGLSSSSNSDANGGIVVNGMYFPANDSESDSHAGLIGPVSSKTVSHATYPPAYDYCNGGASGIANYGTLHAEAYGSGGAGGDGADTSRWFDTITVTSYTLPAGSPVTLLADAHYTGTISVYAEDPLQNANPLFKTQASVMFRSDIGATPFTYSNMLDITNVSVLGTQQILPIDQEMRQLITTYVGATLSLDSQIDISVLGRGGNFKAYGSAQGSVDSVFDVQSQTAGITLIRASSAAPAPSSLVTILLGGGMLGAVLRQRRRELKTPGIQRR